MPLWNLVLLLKQSFRNLVVYLIPRECGIGWDIFNAPLDSHTSTESSAQWLDYNINKQKNKMPKLAFNFYEVS